MAKSSKGTKRSGSKTSGVAGAAKTFRKDFALAGSVARWLIVIALSGIALSILFTVAVIVIAATIVAPRVATLSNRLKKSPAMHSGSAKDKCVAFFTETGHVLFPEEPDDANVQAAEQQCATPRQVQAGAQMFDAAVSDPAHAAHAASSHAAVIREASLASKAKSMTAAMPDGPAAGAEPDPHSSDHGHGGNTASTAGDATGLGVHQ